MFNVVKMFHNILTSPPSPSPIRRGEKYNEKLYRMGLLHKLFFVILNEEAFTFPGDSVTFTY